MAKKKIAETGNQEVMNIRGIATFPEVVDGKCSVCVAVTDEVLKKVIDKAKLVNPELEMTFNDITLGEGEEKLELNGVHAKSRFSVDVFDAQGRALDDEEFEVYWNADITVRINLKEYEYKGKQGITAYLMGVKVWEQGEKRGVSFEDFDEE